MPESPDTLHELGNGRYRVALTAAGGGRSSRDWIALNRWPADPVEDAHGFFIYLRDLDSKVLWSAGLQPMAAAGGSHDCMATADALCLHRSTEDIASRLTIRVDPHDDVEFRTLELHNRSRARRRIEISSCIEIALAHPDADLDHPCFLKLFVQTARDAQAGLLLASRRPRAADEHWPVMFHALRGATASAWETDRAVFIGRGHHAGNPALAMRGTVGNVLDPVFCLRTRVELAPGGRCSLDFLLGAADDIDAARALAARHCATSFGTTENDDAPAAAAIGHGFVDYGRAYRIDMPWAGGGPRRPPMPWINVLANEDFGCLVSESGAGCSWRGNSQQHRLTPWSADPVVDPHTEALYLRDDASGAFWSPLAGPCPAQTAHSAEHGFGVSRFLSTSNGLEQRVTMFVARAAPLKCVFVELRNTGRTPRQLSVYSYQQLVLGTRPDASRPVHSWAENDALYARGDAPDDFSGRVAFAAGRGGAPVSWTCDRATFIGLHRGPQNPAGLDARQLDRRCGDGLDPCFAQHRQLHLEAGGATRCAFMLGECDDAATAAGLLARYPSLDALDAALEEVSDFWRTALDGLQVSTPSTEIDAMVNGWLPYQALACRLWARSAFYQSSGAYGFRDQLQDAGNLALLWPGRTRAQILLHAQRQFPEGDVLHWWHDAPVLRGLRTRFADDLLWLPYVTYRYVRDSGDTAIYDQMLPFLDAPPLEPGEDERYLQPPVTAESASLYEHCCRAIDRSLEIGAHGLPLMGTGDWNDGMNRIGRRGRGESVWLAFFLHDLLAPFAELAQQRGETARASRYREHREALRQAADDAGWDGLWYRRAYDDDGRPLGTASAAECRIDGLVQAWAVLSGAASPDRAAQAMDAVERHLIDDDQGLMRLLTPPFADMAQDPGYIKGYLPGVRENGGQYSHAACWMIAALARLGRRGRAAALLARMSGVWHTRDASALPRYRVEPYVMAADIYGAPPHVGRGGWTWYTGAAGWTWRVAVESVLGLQWRDGRRLLLAPCVPDDWPGYRIDFRPPGSDTRFEIEVVNPERCSASVVAASCDGQPLPIREGALDWVPDDDGATHRLVVRLGAVPALSASGPTA